ncbi:YgaP family membrane protein [Paracoccus alkenifer]|uniref:Inner membrane protein YgaP-like transmembrane domain-containing protein n=1 Tax=Paracoccus alkenifer TaxID=65735 RepID=A0A1H6K7U2_9RHOB|nr:DUF2892 domain-containing protein [Paracoccus alkenifer]SEH69398.1 Protein of unknown function [Paracoccus alkenifer]
MQANIGNTERIVRLIVGVVLVLLPFLTGFAPVWTWVSVIVGLVLVGTAAVRFCPLWKILGICTIEGRK